MARILQLAALTLIAPLCAQNGDRNGEVQGALPADLAIPAAPVLSAEEELATFVSLMTKVIEETDTPWVPDALVDPIMVSLLEPLAEMAIKFSKGEVAVNSS